MTTVEFTASCPECGLDALWINGLQYVGEPRVAYVGANNPETRPQCVTSTCHCPCQPKDPSCAAS